MKARWSRRSFLPLLPSLLPAIMSSGCSRMPALTPESLEAALRKWRSTRPGYYRLAVEMRGDRVEAERFEVVVAGEEVVSLRRNGQVVLPGRGQAYSMDGLFRMLAQELELARKPELLGAPAGYSAYLTARFDPATGRLVRYRRTVGGTKNTIDIDILDFSEMDQARRP